MGSSNSFLDDIREDIAEMLNLQQKIIRFDSVLFAQAVIYTDSQLESFAIEHAKLTEKFEILKEKYNIG